jgi:hypothetical protein
MIPHHRTGVSRRAESRIELGGQSVEIGLGGKVSANPSFAPR